MSDNFVSLPSIHTQRTVRNATLMMALTVLSILCFWAEVTTPWKNFASYVVQSLAYVLFACLTGLLISYTLFRAFAWVSFCVQVTPKGMNCRLKELAVHHLQIEWTDKVWVIPMHRQTLILTQSQIFTVPASTSNYESLTTLLQARFPNIGLMLPDSLRQSLEAVNAIPKERFKLLVNWVQQQTNQNSYLAARTAINILHYNKVKVTIERQFTNHIFTAIGLLCFLCAFILRYNYMVGSKP